MHYHALLAITWKSIYHHYKPRVILYGIRTTLESPHREHVGPQFSKIPTGTMARDHTDVSCPFSLTALLQRSLTPLQSYANISTFLEKPNANYCKSYWVHGLSPRKRNYFTHITDLGLWRTESELNLPHDSLVMDTHSQLKWWLK